jgi:hypothetical protein
MRFVIIAIIFITVLSCKNNTKQISDKSIEIEDSKQAKCVSDTSRASTHGYKAIIEVSTLKGKPIDFYLNHPDISKNAKSLYKCEIVPSDNDCTFAILDSSCTKNAETRPFYLHLLMFMNTVSDGALSEVMGGYDMKFLNEHPNEFFDYVTEMKANEALNSVITYIGFEFYAGTTKNTFNEFKVDFKKKIQSKHLKNADNFLRAIKEQIEKNVKNDN